MCIRDRLRTLQQRNQNVTPHGKFDLKKMTMSRKYHILIRKRGRLAPNNHVSVFDIHYKCPLAQCKMYAANIQNWPLQTKFKIQNRWYNWMLLSDQLLIDSNVWKKNCKRSCEEWTSELCLSLRVIKLTNIWSLWTQNRSFYMVLYNPRHSSASAIWTSSSLFSLKRKLRLCTYAFLLLLAGNAALAIPPSFDKPGSKNKGRFTL